MDLGPISSCERTAHTVIHKFLKRGRFPVNRRSGLKHILPLVLTLAPFVLMACTAQSVDSARDQSSCEIKLDAVCANAVDSYLAAEAARPAKAAESKSQRLEPLVAPVKLRDGQLAAEVDCYISFDPNGPWLVYAHLAIPPSSSKAVEHLREHGLCESPSPERSLASGTTSHDL